MRKLALAVAVAMASNRLYALGLGEIELHSALNEPLNAEVRLLAPQPGELDNAVVQLAPNNEFTRAGIDRPAILSNINFTIVRDKDGAAILNITSKQPIREPFLDFIVQLSWQSGRLLREYTLLLDPPVFGEEKKAPVTAPETVAPAPVQSMSAETPTPPMESMEAMAPAQPTGPMQTPQTSTAAGGNTFTSKVKHDQSGSSYGLTQRNDTLWNIASNLLPDDSVSVYQMMMALLKENPQAFYDDNVNSLKAGYILRIPEKSKIAAIDEKQAEQEAARQYASWIQARQGVSKVGEKAVTAPSKGKSTEQGVQQSGTESPTSKESAHLRLVAPGDAAATSTAAGGGTQADLEKLRGELAIAMESSDSAKRESDELRSRVATLEDQINSLQRLLTLKDEALNDLQKRSGMTAKQSSTESTAPTVEVPPATPVKPVPAKPTTHQPPAPKAKEPSGMFTNPTLIGTVAAAVLLLLSVLWLILRRRRNDNDEGSAPISAPIEDAAEEDLPPLSESQPNEDVFAETSVTDDLGDSQQMTQIAEEVAHDVEDDLTQTANDLDMLHTPEGDIDPIVEADVYLAYRRYQQAEALVQGALAKQPGRQDLQAKLLEIYYAAKNADSFQTVAQSLYENLGSNPNDATWQRILPMGRELCPDHPLFSSEQASNQVETSGTGPTSSENLQGVGSRSTDTRSATEESLDLNLGGGGGSQDSAKGANASQDEKTEFDLDLGGEAPRSAVQASGENAPATGNKVQADGLGNAGGQTTDDQKNSWEIEPATSEFGNIDFGLDDGDLLAGTDVVGTKLDLARAYIDMGDNDSARDILTEVIEEGNDQQKQEAKGLVEKIA